MEEIRNGESKVRKLLRSEISLIFGVIAVFVPAFIYLTNPNSENKTALLLQEERISAQRKTIDDLTKTQQNDTQEIKSELRNMSDELETICISIKELETIINERIPKK